MDLIRKNIIALSIGLSTVAAIVLSLAIPGQTFAAPYTMTSVSIPGEDILATAVNIFGSLTPIVVIVAGLSLGMWLLKSVVGFFKGRA